jgi:hypothetical protein
MGDIVVSYQDTAPRHSMGPYSSCSGRIAHDHEPKQCFLVGHSWGSGGAAVYQFQLRTSSVATLEWDIYPAYCASLLSIFCL